ncbi:peptidoglycan/xylan/chitin deacetylase (PgdA/CDA1 family) [Paenibacillus shirakamiensis]|uniref:Peptidoglycan/xylan/chitin deacetylase (PgdA/CDA1 family) n=1 Tax=Paenibacillus shirakamiensis TaxID=1265935 RepID=A0ABS4JCR2_9BACL|nr:polysaccharide deacetylase family protein [Paenibacillus shirakamiensis]MBP1999512.1 peptidoglycan/xylan/chitin deacetylase (PgdA/CDA1 family) [Paenibacillus shirakamiensis]
MNKKLLVVAVLSLLLSACGQKSDSSSQAPAPESVSKPATPPTTPVDNTKPSTPSTAEPTTPADPAEIPLKYHMNKVYNIVPNEEGTEKKVVLLTFDDGPKEKVMIDGLIDVLDKHKAKAIFFVNGYRVKQNPDLLKLIHERNQIIGNHSWDHISLKKQPEAKVKKQIEDVQQAVKELTGQTPTFFRPPFGEGGDVGRKVAQDNHLLYMTWSNGSLDWTLKSKGTNNPETVVKNVLDQLHPGSNILMHELPWTVAALDNLLTRLEEKGYSFVDPRSIDTNYKESK